MTDDYCKMINYLFTMIFNTVLSKDEKYVMMKESTCYLLLALIHHDVVVKVILIKCALLDLLTAY